MKHPDKERIAELEARIAKFKRIIDLEEMIAKGIIKKPKLTIKGEIVFIVALAFIVVSLIILF